MAGFSRRTILGATAVPALAPGGALTADRPARGGGEARTPEMFGAAGDGSRDDTGAFRAAMAAGPGEVVLNARRYAVGSISIPNNVSVRGAGMGFGVNARTEIVCLDASAPAVEYQGYYSHLEGVLIRYGGDPGRRAGSVGVRYGLAPDGAQVTNTSMAYVTVVGFGTGIQNNGRTTSFTHLHRRVYVKDNLVGVDMSRVNNAVFDACSIDSNGLGARFDTFTNVVFANGCVLQVFGDRRLSEAADSKILVLSNGKGFICRDFYGEIGSRAGAGSRVQFAQVGSVNGLTIEGGYLNRSAASQPPLIEFMDPNSSAVSIRNNYVLRGPSAGTDPFVDGATEDARRSLFGFDIANNAVKVSLIERPTAFSPVLLEGGAPIPGASFSALEGSCRSSGGMTQVSIDIAVSNPGGAGRGPLAIRLPVAMGQGGEATGMLAAVGLAGPAEGLTCLIQGGRDLLTPCRNLDVPLRGSDLAPQTRLKLSIVYPTGRQAISPGA